MGEAIHSGMRLPMSRCALLSGTLDKDHFSSLCY